MHPRLARLHHSTLLAVGREAPADAGERRLVGVARGALTALGVRGLGVLAGLVAVPLTLGYLGPERYGAWMAIAAVLAWLQVADLGIANGLTNAVSEAYALAEPQTAQGHVATAFWSLLTVAALLGVGFGFASPHVDWAALFNVQSPDAVAEIGAAVALAVGLFLAALPFTTLDRIYLAHQQGTLANLWSAFGNIVSLVAIWLATTTGGGLVTLVLAAQGTQLGVQVLNAVWLFGRHRPNLRPAPGRIRRGSLARLTRDGGRFFAIQVLGILLFSIDQIVIARVLGAEQVTPYAVAWRLFGLVNMVATVYAPYLWPVYAEARARGDFAWIARTLRWTVVASVGATVLPVVGLAVFGRPIIEAWAGASAVSPPSLLLWMAVLTVFLVAGSAFACMLNGVGQLTGQMVYGALAAAANVFLSIVFASRYGIVGVTAATVMAYGALALVPTAFEAAVTLRRLRDAARAVAPAMK